MGEGCILGMGNSSLRNPTLLLGVALGSRANVAHQPTVEDPLAIQGERTTWHDIENLQCLIHR